MSDSEADSAAVFDPEPKYEPAPTSGGPYRTGSCFPSAGLYAMRFPSRAASASPVSYGVFPPPGTRVPWENSAYICGISPVLPPILF